MFAHYFSSQSQSRRCVVRKRDIAGVSSFSVVSLLTQSGIRRQSRVCVSINSSHYFAVSVMVFFPCYRQDEWPDPLTSPCSLSISDWLEIRRNEETSILPRQGNKRAGNCVRSDTLLREGEQARNEATENDDRIDKNGVIISRNSVCEKAGGALSPFSTHYLAFLTIQKREERDVQRREGVREGKLPPLSRPELQADCAVERGWPILGRPSTMIPWPSISRYTLSSSSCSTVVH